MRAHETWKRLGPGIYADAAGDWHVLDAEVLAALGVEDTPANRGVVREAVAEVMRREGADVVEGQPVRVVHVEGR